ncbi:HPP family protein [Alkalimarinus sediminis]|uniref:HPP family protein n=1 Tax=Alkalimarinus sediminis TaxID=1632866 RepID=A0A9E8HGA7_9ALTE|nr:HPP family protein [Alkalimarinus sediminis]UZW74128.1 HPP family protein [Alkalimarinus sediminis]
MKADWLRETALVLGVEQNNTSHAEKLVSSLGGLIGIAVVYFLSLEHESALSSALIVASMGASAVLVFAVPHGALSQPWPVLGGHLISAIIGVSCFKLFDNILVASSAAVGLAILSMYYMRCLHPPGGATALLAVIGGPSINSMEFAFVINPILSNISILLLTAIAFNSLFRWRRYPAHGITTSQRIAAHKRATPEHNLTQEDFTAALQQLDSFIDVSAEDLSDIFERALRHTENHDTTIAPASIATGACYSNGKLGFHWSIRQITQLSGNLIEYEVVSGQNKGETAHCTREQFVIWARYRVKRQEKQWVREFQLLSSEEVQPC